MSWYLAKIWFELSKVLALRINVQPRPKAVPKATNNTDVNAVAAAMRLRRRLSCKGGSSGLGGGIS